MGKDLIYPVPEKIIELNKIILRFLPLKKADEAKVLSVKKIQECIEECKENKGDIHEKATLLLINLIQKHPFASGNRRTAFLTIKWFLLQNESYLKLKDDPKHAKIMLGIREGFYNPEEIKEWIKHGQIREFRPSRKS